MPLARSARVDRPAGDGHERFGAECGGDLRLGAKEPGRVFAGADDERLAVHDGAVGERALGVGAVVDGGLLDAGFEHRGPDLPPAVLLGQVGQLLRPTRIGLVEVDGVSSPMAPK